VHDAAPVRGVESVCKLHTDIDRLREREAFGGNGLGQRAPIHQLHREVVDAVGLFHRIDRDDARMVQRGNRLRFTLESGQRVRIRGQLRRDRLQRDLAVELQILGDVDVSHPARPERALDAIVTERPADHGQYVARPPDTSNTAPVVNEFSSETSHATIAAISSTSTKRPRGIFDSM
jgi:hypothetical protein